MNKPNIQKPELLNIEELQRNGSENQFDDAIDRDFGSATDGLGEDGLSRRRWLQLMGASLALGGTVGCRYQQETIAPFAFRPQNRIPGVAEKFSAMLDFAGVAQPLVGTCYDGRPIKLDGNPIHPNSGNPANANDPSINRKVGGSTVYTQAEILNLYDPDRLRAPLKAEGDKLAETSMEAFLAGGDFLQAGSLQGVAILSESQSSPSLALLRKEFEAKSGAWYTFESLSNDNARAGSKVAFGAALRPHYQLDKAKVIVCFDDDILVNHPAGVSNSRLFAEGRDADHEKMSRLYVVESQFTHTGSSADHRLALASSKIPALVNAVAAQVESGSKGQEVDDSLTYREKVVACLVQDLLDHPGESVVTAGENQPAVVHALVNQLNAKLGNVGKTVLFTEEHDADRVSTVDAISDLSAKIQSKEIKSLVILGGNPVYGAPADLKFADAVRSLENTVHITTSKNETSVCCKFVGGLAHQLECWTDGRAYDGSHCIGQPLIRPLFDGLSAVELLAKMMGREVNTALEIAKSVAGLSEEKWNQAVHDGYADGTAAKPVTPTLKPVEVGSDKDWASQSDDLELVFTQSNSLYDGRFANNAWLQELPDFFTKITWDNVANIAPATAKKVFKTDDLKQVQAMRISVKLGDQEVRIPVNIQPGQAEGSVGIAVGYGRTQAGRVGGNLEASLVRYAWGAEKVGEDVGVLRNCDHWRVATGVELTRSGDKRKLAMVQEPWAIDETGRNEIQTRMFRNLDPAKGGRSALIREGTYASFKKFMAKHDGHDHDHDHKNHAEGKKEEHKEGGENAKNEIRKTGPNGALPILTPVSFEEQEHGDGDHGHHSTPHWPEAFHLHHENFDITPGAREDYRVDKVQKDKYGNDEGNRWGMSIDLNKCSGCNACVIACQAENNIPVVGRSQVWRGREMHWLRIDRYYGVNLYNKEAADAGEKQIVHQPVACHHCENAPCETVCPVAATVHSHEGLNTMVYNRCIGTRYCGNNCPYKVRRFNFFNYSDAVTFLKYPGADKLPQADQQLLSLVNNPEVTIRTRGVMEKCTYCVQRIMATKIEAKNEKRPIGPDEITVACQDACACNAIEFGDLTNKESKVAKAHKNPRAYVMLEELNNYPRTKYLARVRNPHPALVDFDDSDDVRDLPH